MAHTYYKGAGTSKLCMNFQEAWSSTQQYCDLYENVVVWCLMGNLVGGLVAIFIFPYIGNNHPNWLIFFRGVETTNQEIILINFTTSARRDITRIDANGTDNYPQLANFPTDGDGHPTFHRSRYTMFSRSVRWPVAMYLLFFIMAFI